MRSGVHWRWTQSRSLRAKSSHQQDRRFEQEAATALLDEGRSSLHLWRKAVLRRWLADVNPGGVDWKQLKLLLSAEKVRAWC